jgi:hypothetical protein
MTNNIDHYGDEPYDERDYEERDLVEAEVHTLPSCNFCGEVAEYDFKTKRGPWAYGCLKHWREHRFYDTLGTGKAQKLVVGA